MPRSVPRRALLRLGATGLTVAIAGCSAALPETPDDRPTDANRSDDDLSDETDSDPQKIDDWQYDPRAEQRAKNASGGSGGGGDGGDAGGAVATVTQAASESIGLAAGGAKDIAQFRRNIEEGYLPIPSDLTYEGLFYEYYFDTGDPGSCTATFCPSYSPAISQDPLGDAVERYFTVGLNSGLDAADFERKTLNLVVVLDVSGSMESAFDRYYYDRFGNKREVEEHTGRPKIDVATETVADLTTHLRAEDRFGMVVFNDRAQVAKPLRKVGETDMDAIREHITDLEANGGTRLSGGIEEATALLGEYDDADPTEYENRMITVTDAMPNLGETDQGGLRGTLASNADRNLYTTFVGVGIDVNTELVDAITAIEGANVYAVHSAKQFRKRLDEEFEYMVTPLLFDLSLELDAGGYEVDAVYGSTAAEEATARLMHVNTLFPAPRREGKTRGGVVLAKVADTGEGSALTLRADWTTRSGAQRSRTATVQFPERDPDTFASSGVRKTVLLTRYADLLKSWMVYERTGADPTTSRGVEPPDEKYLGKWERQSTQLTVSERYRDRFSRFAEHFKSEMTAIGDDALQQELDVLRRLASY